MKIWCMIETLKNNLHSDPFWKLDSEIALKLIDSQLREIKTLEYIYNLIENE